MFLAWVVAIDRAGAESGRRRNLLHAGAFDTLRDQPTRFDPLAVALWRRERERAIEQAEKVRAGPPRFGLDDLDPHHLRDGLALALIIALAVAGLNAPDRLARAFLPDPGPLLGDKPMAVEAWATPADYTHAPPVSLSDRIGESVAFLGGGKTFSIWEPSAADEFLAKAGSRALAERRVLKPDGERQ